MPSNLIKVGALFICLLSLAGCTPDDCNIMDELGLYDCAMEHDGAGRYYVLRVPNNYAGDSTPLVIDLHGYASPVAGVFPAQRFISGVDRKAQEEGFIAVWPQGLLMLGISWNHNLPKNYTDRSADDVDFILAMIEHLKTTLNIDPSRIYVTGVSMGGGMAQTLGCAAPETFAAISTVSMPIPRLNDDCETGTSVPIISFHSTTDWLIPYEGNEAFNLLAPGSYLTLLSAPESFDVWSDRNHCTDEPRTTYEKGSASCLTRDACDDGAEVTFCTLDGKGLFLGGHLAYGNNDRVNVMDLTWEHFKKHTREIP